MAEENNQQNQQQNQQQQNQQQNQQQQNQQTTQSWEDVLKALPKEQQALYEAHTQGLQNSVRATRDERDGLKNQLQEALKKAEKGSEFEKNLTESLEKVNSLEKRANFAEQAIKPEIGCRNVKAAFALALAEDYFRKNGDPDWEAIKKEAPELFGAIIPDANGGNGTGGGGNGATDMNAIIRGSVGQKN